LTIKILPFHHISLLSDYILLLAHCKIVDHYVKDNAVMPKGNSQQYSIQEFLYQATKKFSEIFNPIYLALNCPDREGKTMNISLEKEEIVRQIREFITAK